MQWYLTNKSRLELEVEIMKGNGVNFQLCSDERGNLLWRGPLLVCGHYHSDVRLVYPENFPYQKIEVYVLNPKIPPVIYHVHEDGRICYMKEDSEWSANWTAYTVYLTTIRFLYDFYNGKMYEAQYPISLPLNQHPVSFPPNQHENLLKKIWRGLFG